MELMALNRERGRKGSEVVRAEVGGAGVAVKLPGESLNVTLLLGALSYNWYYTHLVNVKLPLHLASHSGYFFYRRLEAIHSTPAATIS